MTTVQIALPDQLAKEAQRAGVLSQPARERLLREQLRRSVRMVFAARKRMEQLAQPPAMSPAEVAGRYAHA